MRTLRSTLSRHAGAAGLATLLAVSLGACAANTAPAGDSSATAATSASATTSGMSGMSGMSGTDEPMYTGNGLSASSGGFTLVPTDAATAFPANRAFTLSFRIEDAMGMAVTSFQDDQTKLMHFYVVRSDLAGFQHVHPTMAADGTWSASLAAMQPGAYRAYASFITKNSGGTAVALVLSEQFTVAGPASTATALPAASATTEVDGYTVSLSGDLMSGMQHMLTATITKDGVPVTDLQPYLDTYAHLTAFHQGDMAFAHLHPQGTVNGDHGGPTLTFEAAMAEAGDYRLYLQFQTGGVLHTAAITVHVA